MKKIVLISLTASFIFAQQSALDYLNSMRTNAGLIKFKENSILNDAAQNHAKYMDTNNIATHTEDDSNPGFTGKTPSDRAVAAGYYSLNISENLSWGQDNYNASIDSLMSAIYHRLGFLSLSKNEIGIGAEGKYYNYDMGNSNLNELCQGNSDNSGYKNVCANTNKIIATQKYDNAINSIKSKAKDIILWPYPGAKDILPAFFSEEPDPLPNYDVSGYPVSVEFNDINYTKAENIKINYFTLYNENNYSLELINIGINNEPYMYSKNDRNGKFTKTQFAIFPKERLEWGSRYYAELNFNYNNKEYTKRWCFSTRSLDADAVYRIMGDANLTVKNGKKYAIYFVPRNANDTLGNVNYSYNTQKLDFKYVDKNTFYITLNGNNGNFVDFNFSNGVKINLTISNSDSAKAPKHELCAEDKIIDNSNTDNSSKDNTNDSNVNNSSNTQINTTANSVSPQSHGASFNSVGVLLMLSSLFLLTFIRKENS